jgi:predicted TPR repeat methyltransferase
MLLRTLRTSGDLLADRRYAYAQGAFEDGDFAAAADLARQAVERAPSFAPAHALLGRAQAALGQSKAAVASLGRALDLEPDDPLGVRIDLANLDVLPSDTAMTQAYVQALFDDYAPRFERHLVRTLDYCGPELIADALQRACTRRFRDFRFARAVDLGCGTGLMGQALADAVEHLDGVDLSPRMLAQAAKTRLYDTLHETDAATFLRSLPDGGCDLVLAADVLPYMAALDDLFGQTSRSLAKGGLFAFTAQVHDGDGVLLGQDARYAHSEAYLQRVAGQAGLRPVLIEEASIRKDRGQPVPGVVAVLEKELRRS